MGRPNLKISLLVLFVVVVTIGNFLLGKLTFKEEKYNLHDNTKPFNSNFSDEFYNKQSPREVVINIYLPMQIKGIVIGKYIKRMAHGLELVWVEDQQSYYNIRPRFIFEKDPEFYDEIDIGDSIFKNAGSLIFSVKRDTLIKNFRMSSYEQYWINPYYPQNTSTLK